MKRGILPITTTDSQILAQFVNELTPKYQFSNLEDKIEISEEEAEYLLDLLPPPTTNEDINLKNFRQKIQEFLLKLRNNGSI